jgi:hypothetical protein
MHLGASALEWLRVEAYSNYLVFLTGLIFGILAAFIRHFFRKRPRVEVSRIKQGELFRYSSDIAESLSISYKENIVKELHGTELVIRNLGNAVLENIRLHITLAPELEPFELLEFSIGDETDPARRASIAVKSGPLKDNGEAPVELAIPYLNNFSDHEDLLTVKIYSDRAIKISNLQGGGAGWSAKYFDKYGVWKKFESEVSNNSGFINVTYWTIRTLIVRFRF